MHQYQNINLGVRSIYQKHYAMSTLQCSFDQFIQMPIYDQYPQLSNDDNTSLVHLIIEAVELTTKNDKNLIQNH